MSKLTNLLEYYTANDSDRKNLLNSEKFNKELNLTQERKELLISDDDASLINEEIAAVILNGANKRRLVRDVIPTYDVSKHTAKVPYGVAPNDYVGFLSQGATIPTLDGTYGSGTANIKKFAVRTGITREMIEDCEFQLIEAELMRAGAILENSLNREGISVLLNNHNGTNPTDVDPEGSGMTYYDVIKAKNSVTDRHWMPDKFLALPAAMKQIVSSNIDIGTISFKKGETFIDLEFYELDATTYSGSTNQWDSTNTAGHYCGLVLDSTNYAGILMRDDIGVESQMRDPVDDLVNVVVSMRASVCVFSNDAACRILTK